MDAPWAGFVALALWFRSESEDDLPRTSRVASCRARRVAILLHLRSGRAARGVPIDSYSTHHADRLAPDSLTR